MAFSSGLNPDVVKTELDDVFFQNFRPETIPGWSTSETDMLFRQDTTGMSAVQEEVFKGVGLWSIRAEEQDVQDEDPRVANKQTFNVANYAKGIDISKNFFDDNMFSTYERAIIDFAVKGRITQDDNAFKLWRDSFTSALTADAVSIVNDSHTTINGGSVDNKETTALSESSLNTMIIKLAEQKDQNDVVRGHTPQSLLVPPALFKTAAEILDSELKSGVTDNDDNIYLTKYGIALHTSNRLGAVITGPGDGGSDTAHWLLAPNHSMRRWVRQGMETVLVDWRIQRNNNYIYKGEFREVIGAIDYSGIIGATGLT